MGNSWTALFDVEYTALKHLMRSVSGDNQLGFWETINILIKFERALD